VTSDINTRARRNAARLALRHNAARRAELLALRERNVHAVDHHALSDLSRNDVVHAAELRAAGGDLHDLDATW
jgi:hypothetical protein